MSSADLIGVNPRLATCLNQLTQDKRDSKDNVYLASKSKWTSLSKSLMELNEFNYAQRRNTVISNLLNVIQGESEFSDSAIITVLYIIYERALRELITSSFPVSANIIDALSNHSEEMCGIIQKLIKVNFEELRRKLNNHLPLSGNDAGVVFLFLNIYRLDKAGGRNSSLFTIIEMIIKDVSHYVKSFNSVNSIDVLIMLVYSISWFSIQNRYKTYDTVLLIDFMRKLLIKHSDSISEFSKVLITDILEQSQNRGLQAILYTGVFKTVFRSEIYIIPGLKDAVLGTFDKSRVEPDGQSSHSEEEETQRDEEQIQKKEEEDQKEAPIEEPESPVQEKEVELNWSISENNEENLTEETESVEKISVVINIPEKCVGRIVGYEGAIARKLELESNTTIEFSPKEPERPATSCLTAHRLITGALNMPVKLPPGQLQEEKEKLSAAKIKFLSQTAERVEQSMDVKISGTEDEIKKATELINDILTHVVTIHIPLDFSVDEIWDRYSGKLKTIESLLNIYLEIEELDDEKVVLNLSGDEKSCKDAKKLIFEELGSFRSQHGHLFFVPAELMKVLKDVRGLTKMLKNVHHITGGRLLNLQNRDGQAIFISGFSNQVNKALQIFQRVNSELLCCLSDTSGETVTENELNVKTICDFIDECFGGERKRNISRRATLLKRNVPGEESKKGLVYRKETLIELSSSPLSKQFPKHILLNNDPIVQLIVLKEGLSTENLKHVRELR